MYKKDAYKDLLALRGGMQTALHKLDRAIIHSGSNEALGELAMNIIKNRGRFVERDFEEGAKKYIIFYRKIACYVLLKHCGWECKATAKRVGVTNHATAIHHAKEIESWFKDKRFAPKDYIYETTQILNRLNDYVTDKNNGLSTQVS